MTDQTPTRRDLLKPVQLLGFAFAAAVFAGVISLMSMGFFQTIPEDRKAHALVVALIVAGVAFIATLLIMALLILVVDPKDLATPVDRPVLFPDEPTDAAGGASERPTSSH